MVVRLGAWARPGLLLLTSGLALLPALHAGAPSSGGGGPLSLADSSRPTPAAFVRDEREEVRVRGADRAIRRGLAYLQRKQEGGSGALSSRFPVAVTALGGMAFLGAGVGYKRGEHGEVLQRAVDYLLLRQQDSGYIADTGEFRSRMHGHAYAVLFLSQVLGGIPHKTKEAAVRNAVEKGVRVILDSQTAKGGWGYEPYGRERNFDEASITVCCLQALRAARDAGVDVPASKIKKAVWYLKECCKDDGSFRYSLARHSDKSTYELTAAAVSTLDAAGEYGIEEHKRGVSFLLERLRQTRQRGGNPLDASTTYAYYGNLYAAQVLHQLGGEVWRSWAADALPRLMEQQNRSGAWESSRYGDEYATAMALLVLEIPLGYLPIFER